MNEHNNPQYQPQTPPEAGPTFPVDPSQDPQTSMPAGASNPASTDSPGSTPPPAQSLATPLPATFEQPPSLQEPPAKPVKQVVGHSLTTPVTFEQYYRTPLNTWWKPMVSVLVVGAAFFILSNIFSIIAIAIDIATGAYSFEDVTSGKLVVTPLMLFLGVNLPLIISGAVAYLMHRVIHKAPGTTFWSVENSLRLSWLGVVFAITVPLLGAYVVISGVLLTDNPTLADIGGREILFLLIVIFTTPLQALAEEMMFRGLLPRAISNWIPNPTVGFWVGAIVSSLMFMVAHLAADPWLMLYYFIFGMMAILATRYTGGLEAAIAIHVVNNVFAFITTIFLGQMDSAFDRSAGVAGPFMLIQIAAIAIMACILMFVAYQRKVSITGIPIERTGSKSHAPDYPAAHQPSQNQPTPPREGEKS